GRRSRSLEREGEAAAPVRAEHHHPLRRARPSPAGTRGPARSRGGADVTSTFDLAADGDGTLMHWRTEISFSGLLSHFAGPGLDVVARRQAALTLDAVERAL